MNTSRSPIPTNSFHPLHSNIQTSHFPCGGRQFSEQTGKTSAMKQEADNTSDPPYTEQQTEAVECIYTPITCTSQRAHGAKTRRKEWDGKRPHQVDQQRAIDSRDLYWCQSGSQTGSQLWFVPITSLTLFNLGFGQLAAQTTSVHWKRKWEIHICSTALNLNTEIHYMTCNL